MESEITDGKEAKQGDRMTWWCLHKGAAWMTKKSLPKTGIDPMPLAFKASGLACFRGRHDQTCGRFLSRQVGCPLRHWGYAALVQDLEY